VQQQEAEKQIITHYEIFEQRPSDRHLLLAALEVHRRALGRIPQLIAADAVYYSQGNERAAQAMGVKYVSIPNRHRHNEERRRFQKQRWFKNGQEW